MQFQNPLKLADVMEIERVIYVVIRLDSDYAEVVARGISITGGLKQL
jgi:hypothetical protein